jgi:hypothetical protein
MDNTVKVGNMTFRVTNTEQVVQLTVDGPGERRTYQFPPTSARALASGIMGAAADAKKGA